MDDNFLYHHGITGQKWGVRRYQNKDGTLTPAGKRRLSDLEGEVEQLKKSDPQGPSKQTQESSKPLSSMKTQELIELRNRLQMQRDIKNFENELNPTPQTFGNAFMNELKPQMARTAVSIISENLKTVANNSIKKLIDKAFGDKTNMSDLYEEVKSLSDEDLNKANKRLAAEQAYIKNKTKQTS